MIIEAHQLSKRYGRRDAVHGLDLSVPEGAAVALIGANGAGKTTTIRLLLNLIAPDGGSATVLGVDSRKLSHREFARIGYVSENQKLPGRLTVDQYFDYLRTIYPVWDTDLERRLRAQFDLPGDRKIKALSHGMRMKTALAAALPFHPDLLVLDEPLSGLDPLVRDEVMEGLLTQAGEMTILISSHELVEIEGAATHVAFIDRGRLRFQESMDDLLAKFRQVTVTLGDAAKPAEAAMKNLPRDWLNPQCAASTFSFVDARFLGDGPLSKQVAERFGGVARIDARPMPLREVSKAMMREIRKETRA